MESELLPSFETAAYVLQAPLSRSSVVISNRYTMLRSCGRYTSTTMLTPVDHVTVNSVFDVNMACTVYKSSTISNVVK